MICLPNLNLINFDNEKEEKKVIYDAIYDIFMAIPDSDVLSKLTYTTSQQEIAEIYKEKEDILDYAEFPKDEQTVQKEIVDVLTEKTIYNYIGFEIISKNTSPFVNRFIQQQNLKTQIMQMIRTCRTLDNKAQYITAV